MTQAEWIYYTMMGEMEIPYPDVDDEFSEGKECQRLYDEIFDVNMRLCQRLGQEEHPDVERITNNFLEMNQKLCLKMFEYGKRFG